jgi:uncharacterized protein YkwD
LLKKTVRRLTLLAMIPAAILGLTFVASPASAAVVPATTLMSQLVTQSNHSRARAGCGQLKVNQALVTASVRHSSYMASTGRFSHTGSGGSNFVIRSRTAGYGAAMGENIGWGYRTSSEMFKAWMASPGHRANILNCSAKSVGIGVVYAKNGTPYYTQDFGRV